MPNRVPVAYVAHRCGSRVRLRIPSRRHDAAFFTHLVAALRDAPGVQVLQVNPRTASALIVGTPVHDILRQGAERGLFHLDEEVPPIVEQVRESAERMDGSLRLMSGNQLDLRALTFVILAGGALLQLARGQWLAPATTLGWYAAAVLAPGWRVQRRT